MHARMCIYTSPFLFAVTNIYCRHRGQFYYRWVHKAHEITVAVLAIASLLRSINDDYVGLLPRTQVVIGIPRRIVALL